MAHYNFTGEATNPTAKQKKLAECLSQLRASNKGVLSNNIAIGYYANIIKQNELHCIAAGGYWGNNFYKFINDTIGLAKATINKHIQVALEFGDGAKMKQEYEKYSFAQLCETIVLPRDKWPLVNHEMSTRDIRALGKIGSAPSQQDDGEELSEIPQDPYVTQKIIFTRELWEKIDELRKQRGETINEFIEIVLTKCIDEKLLDW